MKNRHHPVKKLDIKGLVQSVKRFQLTNDRRRNLGIHCHLGKKVSRREMNQEKGQEEDSGKNHQKMDKAYEDHPDHVGERTPC